MIALLTSLFISLASCVELLVIYDKDPNCPIFYELEKIAAEANREPVPVLKAMKPIQQAATATPVVVEDECSDADEPFEFDEVAGKELHAVHVRSKSRLEKICSNPNNIIYRLIISGYNQNVGLFKVPEGVNRLHTLDFTRVKTYLAFVTNTVDFVNFIMDHTEEQLPFPMGFLLMFNSDADLIERLRNDYRSDMIEAGKTPTVAAPARWSGSCG